MTQFTEPNKKSDLIAPRVIDWLQSLRAGVLEGLIVGPGPGGGFLLNIASGKIVLAGTTIHDDLTRIDSTILSTVLGVGPLGQDTHVLVYGQYTYQDTFPPAAMTLSVVVTTGAPPSPPALPADSIKLADIFIPAGAVDFADANFINAPKIPARGNVDGDVLLERVVHSNHNVVVAGGGAMRLSGGNLSWDADLVLYATTVTNREKYKSAPIAKSTSVAGSVAMGDNAIAFVVFNRADTTPQAPSIQILDLDNPTTAAMSVFFDATTRERIVFVAMSQAGTLIRRAGFGSIFADEVINAPAGDIAATDVQAAIDELDTEKVSLANLALQTGAVDTGARLVGNTALPVGSHLGGVAADDIHEQLEDTYTEIDAALDLHDDSIDTNTLGISDLKKFCFRGIGVRTGCSLSTTGIDGNVTIGTGIFHDAFGNRIVLSSPEVFATTGDGIYILFWNPDSEAFEDIAATTGASEHRLPFCIFERAGGVVTDFVDIKRWVDRGNGIRGFTVGDVAITPQGNANFPNLYTALLAIMSIRHHDKTSKRIYIVDDVSETFKSYGGSISLDTSVDKWFVSPERLNNIHILSDFMDNNTTDLMPTITVGAPGNNGYFLDVDGVRNITIEGVRIYYDGDTAGGDSDVVMFKDPGAGFVARDMVMVGNNKLYGIAKWDSGVSGDTIFGGTFNNDAPSTVFSRIYADTITEGARYVFNIVGGGAGGGNLYGALTIRDCSFHSSPSFEYNSALILNNWQSSHVYDTTIIVDGCTFEGCQNACIDVSFGVNVKTAVSNCHFGESGVLYKAIDAHISGVSGIWSNSHAINCTFDSSNGVVVGGTHMTNCAATGGWVNLGSGKYVNCDFAFGGISAAVWGVGSSVDYILMSNCQIGFGNGGRISGSEVRLSNCELLSLNDAANLMIDVSNLYMDNCSLTFAAAVTIPPAGDAIIDVTSDCHIGNCVINTAGNDRRSSVAAINLTSGSGDEIVIIGNTLYLDNLHALKHVGAVENITIVGNQFTTTLSSIPPTFFWIDGFIYNCNVANNLFDVTSWPSNSVWELIRIEGAGIDTPSICHFNGNDAYTASLAVVYHAELVFKDMTHLFMNGNRMGDVFIGEGGGVDDVKHAYLTNNAYKALSTADLTNLYQDDPTYALNTNQVI